jgi:hypothetical protein
MDSVFIFTLNGTRLFKKTKKILRKEAKDKLCSLKYTYQFELLKSESNLDETDPIKIVISETQKKQRNKIRLSEMWNFALKWKKNHVYIKQD